MPIINDDRVNSLIQERIQKEDALKEMKAAALCFWHSHSPVERWTLTEFSKMGLVEQNVVLSQTESGTFFFLGTPEDVLEQIRNIKKVQPKTNKYALQKSLSRAFADLNAEYKSYLKRKQNFGNSSSYFNKDPQIRDPGLIQTLEGLNKYILEVQSVNHAFWTRGMANVLSRIQKKILSRGVTDEMVKQASNDLMAADIMKA